MTRTQSHGAPNTKEFVQIDIGIAEQPVDLLDTVFAQRSTDVGQSLSNRIDGQGGSVQHSSGPWASDKTRLACRSPSYNLVMNDFR